MNSHQSAGIGKAHQAGKKSRPRFGVFIGQLEERYQSLIWPGIIDAAEVLDLLEDLMEKSMFSIDHRKGLEPRYRFIETIRQYAREKLSETDEVEELKDRHLAYFLQLAERAYSKLEGPEQTLWLNRLEADQDNFRSALEWSTCSGDGGRFHPGPRPHRRSRWRHR